MDDSQFFILGRESNAINYFNQPPSLGCNSNISVFHDECPITSLNISVSNEYFNLDLESILVKEYVHIKTSSSPHYPLYLTICNPSTCDEDTPCSWVSSFDEVSPWLTLGGEVVHDEIENYKIIENPSHPSSYLLLHEDNSSNNLSHEISLIHFIFEFVIKKYFDLRNLVVEVKKFGKICDRDGFYMIRSGFIKTNNRSYPQTMHDLVQP